MAAFAIVGCGGKAEPFIGPLPGSSPVVTPTPSMIGVSSSALTFAQTGASAAQTFVASEAGYTGLFSESDACANIATVTPASASGPSATFTVTPIGAGSCTVTIADSAKNKTTVNVGVTLSGVTIQGEEK